MCNSCLNHVRYSFGEEVGIGSIANSFGWLPDRSLDTSLSMREENYRSDGEGHVVRLLHVMLFHSLHSTTQLSEKGRELVTRGGSEGH